MNFKSKKISNEQVEQKDVIIAVMGPTGVGKSTFISSACGQTGRVGRTGVGHGLKSFTTDVQPTKITYGQQTVVLVDTPGFDDTNLSDTEILRRIATWLEEQYKGQVKLAGIIYMHRIADNRMAGSPLKNLHMFSRLCGTGAAENVILATTMWDRVSGDVGARREAELKAKFWKGMIDCGAKVARFSGVPQSAWDIIAKVSGSVNREVLLLQEEMVDLQKRLSETEAGKTLYTTLQKQLDEQKRILQELYTEAQRSQNPSLAADLQKQYEATQQQIEATFNQVKELKISLGRRILQFFSFRKAHSAPIRV